MDVLNEAHVSQHWDLGQKLFFLRKTNILITRPKIYRRHLTSPSIHCLSSVWHTQGQARQQKKYWRRKTWCREHTTLFFIRREIIWSNNLFAFQKLATCSTYVNYLFVVIFFVLCLTFGQEATLCVKVALLQLDFAACVFVSRRVWCSMFCLR